MNEFLQAFLQEHPEYLDAIKTFEVDGKPEVCVRPDALRAFIQWSQNHPDVVIGHPEHIAPMLSYIAQVEYGEHGES